MISSRLRTAIDQFVATARQHGQSRAGGADAFAHHSSTSNAGIEQSLSRVPGHYVCREIPGEQSGIANEFCSLRFGDAFAVHSRYHSAAVIERTGGPDHMTICLFLAGHSVQRIGTFVVQRLSAGDIFFIFDRTPALESSYSADCEFLAFVVPIPRTRHLLCDRNGHVDVDGGLYFEHGFTMAAPSDLWNLHLAYVLDSLLAAAAPGAEPVTTNALMAEYLFLLCRDELWSKAENGRASGTFETVPTKLRLAEYYVATNRARAPTVGQVAEHVQLSPRSLQALFNHFRGVSSHDFIHEQRLLGIRDRLREARPGAALAEIAADWGFDDLGNFTSNYERRFGEQPSATLKRRKPGQDKTHAPSDSNR